VQVERTQLGKILYDLLLNALEVVITQVDPEQIVLIPHDTLKHVAETSDGSKLVLLEEERIGLALHHKLLGLTGFLLSLGLLLHVGGDTLCAGSEGNVVLLQDLVDLLIGLGADHDFLGLFVLFGL
jgi:hypothetical protein